MQQEEIPQVRLLPPSEFAILVRRAHLHPTTKFIALHMMTYATYPDGKKGPESRTGKDIFPGESLVADEIGRSQRCVREHLRILRDLRILTRVRHNSGRHGIYDEYWLSWPLDDGKILMRLTPGDNELVPELPPARLHRNRVNEKPRGVIETESDAVSDE